MDQTIAGLYKNQVSDGIKKTLNRIVKNTFRNFFTQCIECCLFCLQCYKQFFKYFSRYITIKTIFLLFSIRKIEYVQVDTFKSLELYVISSFFFIVIKWINEIKILLKQTPNNIIIIKWFKICSVVGCSKVHVILYYTN